MRHYKGKTPKSEWSFERGLFQIPYGLINEVELRIAKVLGLKSVSKRGGSFDYRMYGYKEATKTEWDKITAIFAEYGVTDVWGFGDISIVYKCKM